MRKIKHTLIIVFLCFYHIGLYAQIPGAPTMALSPNAASFRLYGDVPVSHFTGVPEITIPLYNLQVQDFTLPIFLSYHAGGVRVDQRAGWTGVNWTLFAGGIITRTVNDMPDDFDNLRRNNHNWHRIGDRAGFFFNHRVLDRADWNQRGYLRTVAQGRNDANHRDRDTAPDEFFFSFPGYSGRFFLDHTGNWVVQSNRPVRVELCNSREPFLLIPSQLSQYMCNNYGHSRFFSGFTITTGNGTRFQFGKDIDAIDFSINFFNQRSDEWVATAWHLTRITLSNGQEINFTYDRGAFINQLYISVFRRISTNRAGCTPFNSNVPFNIDASIEGKLISPVYLRKISADFATISFYRSVSNELGYERAIYENRFRRRYTDQGHNESAHCRCFPILQQGNTGHQACLSSLERLTWYKLDSIVIQNQTDTLKTIKFSYNNVDTERLFLESVQRSGENPYFFSYYNRNRLPRYLANKSDHWGFFNDNFAHLNPHQDYYNHRRPNPDVLKYGILTRITYPTGGFTEFEFEPHSFRYQLQRERWMLPERQNRNELAGGLRIRRIKHSAVPDGEAQTIREFFYVTDFLEKGRNADFSSGILGGRAQYYFRGHMIYIFGNNDTRIQTFTFSSNSVLPASRNTSSHIGYSEVIEKLPDGSFTRFRFSNFGPDNMDREADAIIQISRVPYERYTSRAHRRGLLLSKETYNSEGVKTSSKTIEHEPSATTNNYVRAMNVRRNRVCIESWEQYDEGVAYRIFTYSMRPRVITETLFENNNAIVTRTEFRYNYRNLISEISTLRGDGRTQRILYHYPFEITTGVQRNILQEMTNRHIISNYVYRISLVDNFVVGGETRIFGRLGNNNNPFFRPEQIQRLRLNKPIDKSPFYHTRYWNFSFFPRFPLDLESGCQNSIGEYRNIDIHYPAVVNIEMASYFTAPIHLPDLSYAIEIRNTVTQRIVRLTGAIHPTRMQGNMAVYNNSHSVNLMPGSYQIRIVHHPHLACGDCQHAHLFQNSFIRFEFAERSINIVQLDFRPEISLNYDNRGNVTEVRLLDCNSVTTYIWGYGSRYPIVQVQGKTRQEIENRLSGADRTLFNQMVLGNSHSDIQIRSFGEMLRQNLSEAFVTTNTFRPLVGVTSITDPRGITTFYEYDSFGRLIKIYRMNNGRQEVLQRFEYHFRE